MFREASHSTSDQKISEQQFIEWGKKNAMLQSHLAALDEFEKYGRLENIPAHQHHHHTQQEPHITTETVPIAPFPPIKEQPKSE